MEEKGASQERTSEQEQQQQYELRQLKSSAVF